MKRQREIADGKRLGRLLRGDEQKRGEKNDFAYEEAKSIADMHSRGYILCGIYRYVLASNKNSILPLDGENNFVIILKENGKVVNAMPYIGMEIGVVIRDFEYRSC